MPRYQIQSKVTTKESTAQIKNRNGVLPILLVQNCICDGRYGGFVHDLIDRQPRNRPGILGGLVLLMVEIDQCGNNGAFEKFHPITLHGLFDLLD